MTVDFAAHIHLGEQAFGPDHAHPLADRLGTKVSDFDALEKIYDDAGVDRAVLSQPVYMGHDDRERTGRANDAMLEGIDGRDRFYGLASIPVGAGPEAAAAEFERCIERGYHGGAVQTESSGIELTDDALVETFEVAERHDAPILVHPKLHDSLGADVLDDTYYLNAILGREVALCESICKLIHRGVLDRHPDLNLVYHHSAGNIAAMLGRVDLHLREGWWPGGEGTTSLKQFKRGLDRLYVDTSGYLDYDLPIRGALETFPASQVLFGTDCPFEARSGADVASVARTVEEHASSWAADDILGGNALEILANVD
jgi:predicted TIM-barrel fold metal-dependent hydrolase